MQDFATLKTIVARNLEYHPDKIALIEGERRLSFRQFADRTRAMGNALLALGLKKGDRVAILSQNSIENAETYFSIPNAGLVLVMLNFRLASPEILTILQDAHVSALIVNEQFMAPIEAIRDKLSFVDHFIFIGARGLGVTMGYWNKPEETAKVFRNGWYYPLDLCRMDADGFIYVVDRKKDMIITGGENVYPAEVENVLYEHPAVAQAAVIGTPDEKWGEAVTAFIVKKKAMTVTAEEIMRFCKEHIAGYKTPKKILFVDALPMSVSGKILKYKLRETAFE